MKYLHYLLTIALFLLSVGLLSACAPLLSEVGDRSGPGTHRFESAQQVQERPRQYLLHVPPLQAVQKALPLVVAVHGAFSTAEIFEQESGWSDLADREGFLVAYPEGFGIFGLLQHWNAGHCCGKAAADQFDDVGFIDRVIEEISAAFPVDPGRIYITGFSNGGMLVHRYAAERPQRIAAAAALGAAVGGRATAEIPVWLPSVPALPVPVLIMHGRADDAVPYGGGRRMDDDSPREYLSVAEAAAFWRKGNRCDETSEYWQLHSGAVDVQRWPCAGGAAEVRLYSLDRWGHQWPGPYFIEKLPPDHPLHGFDAAEQIWRFF